MQQPDAWAPETVQRTATEAGRQWEMVGALSLVVSASRLTFRGRHARVAASRHASAAVLGER